jgi:hypothetical protein
MLRDGASCGKSFAKSKPIPVGEAHLALAQILLLEKRTTLSLAGARQWQYVSR